MFLSVLVCVEVIVQHRFAGNLLCLCQVLGISLTNKTDITLSSRGLQRETHVQYWASLLVNLKGEVHIHEKDHQMGLGLHWLPVRESCPSALLQGVAHEQRLKE